MRKTQRTPCAKLVAESNVRCETPCARRGLTSDTQLVGRVVVGSMEPPAFVVCQGKRALRSIAYHLEVAEHLLGSRRSRAAAGGGHCGGL
jgi:pyrimidine deaminase RibD-like protein